jgi:hypothetical protein
MLRHDKSVPVGAQLIGANERGQGPGRPFGSQIRATKSMVRLSESQQEEALQKVREIRALRKEDLSEDEIAKRLNFTSGLVTSAEVMHGQLERWGFPDWLVYPEGYESRRQREETSEGKGERRARTFGQAEELPRPERAEHIFRNDLAYLSLCVHLLPHLEQRLQANPQRWMANWRIENDWESYERDDYSEEQWRRLCEEYGEDPAKGSFVVNLGPAVSPQWLGATPPKDLVLLIAVHALLTGSIDSLLAELHPNPDEVDREELHRRLNDKKHGYLKHLKSSAEQIAKLVCGGEVSRGTPPPGLSSKEMKVAWHFIHPLAEEGLSNEQILQELGKEQSLESVNYTLGRELTTDDIEWLRGLVDRLVKFLSKQIPT